MDGLEQEFADSVCVECGQAFNRPILRLGGKELFGIKRCPQCWERHDEKIRAEEEEERIARHLLRWNEAIPPLYRESDTNKLNPKALKVAERFNPSGDRGLYLHGDFGKCKTRCGCKILRKAHDQSLSIMMVKSVDFARHCAAQFSDNYEIKRDARAKLDRCKSSGILLIDDLGKERITDRVETELFDVIEDRAACRKPILITSNFELTQLARRMSADQGPAIIRRITEFCFVVEL